MQVVHEIAAHAVYALNVTHLIEKVGSYAGFAAVVGLAILAALYFSQARDVKRLRDWAGRAPERAAEFQSGGRTPEATAVRTGQPSSSVGPAQPVSNPAAPAGAGAAAAQGNGEKAVTGAPATGTPATGAPATGAPAGAVAANAGAAPATATGPATAAGAAAGAGAAPATAAAAAASQPAASAGGTATAPKPGPPPAGARPPAPPGGNTGTGAKVLPARPMPPRPRPVTSGGSGSTAVIPPPKQRRWTAPRYLALIVAGVIVLGLGGTVGVLALTGSDKNSKSGSQGNVPLPSSHGQQKQKPAPKPHRTFAPAIDPSTVTVAVLNGTQVTGLASRIGQKVSTAGFRLGNVATASQQQRAESVVLYKSGSSRQARAVARKLGISQIEPEDAQSATLAGVATVIVVVGADKAVP